MLHKVVICGVDTSKLKTLPPKDACELMLRVKEGDSDARQKFIDGNLKLVLSITRRFIGKRENLDDIFQIGIIGLMKAVDNFDIKFGVKFSTYAVPMIIGEIKRYLRDNTCMRVSRSIRDVAYMALQAKERLQKENGTEVRIEDIAKELGIPYNEVTYAIDSTNEPVSLYASIFDGKDTSIIELCSDEKSSGEKMIQSFLLNNALKNLNEREKEIIDMRYFQGKTQIEVSNEVGISQAQVSRLEKSALKMISKNV